MSSEVEKRITISGDLDRKIKAAVTNECIIQGKKVTEEEWMIKALEHVVKNNRLKVSKTVFPD